MSARYIWPHTGLWTLSTSSLVHLVSGTSLVLPILNICPWKEKVSYAKPEIPMAILSVCSTSCLFLCLFLRIEKAWCFPGIVPALHLRISKHFRKIKINPHSVCIFCVSFITDSLQYCHKAHTENQLEGGKVKQGPVIQYPNFAIRNFRLIYKQFLETGLKIPGLSWKGSVLLSTSYAVEWLEEIIKIIFYPVKNIWDYWSWTSGLFILQGW